MWPMWQAMVMSRRLGVQIAAFAGVTLAAVMLTAILAVDHPAKFWRHRIADISLMHGWVPATVQTISAVVLVGAIGWRTRRWRVLQVPLAFVLGVILAVWAHWDIASTGIAGDPTPRALWIPADSSTARTVLPAMMPVPGEAGRSSTLAPP